MYIAALFTVVRIWKQPKCPMRDDWLKKVWYIYTMEYYSAIRRDEILPFATTWIDLEIIILSDISQTEKDIRTPMFIAALFTVARTWKKPVSCNRRFAKGAVVHIYDGILLRHKKR